MDWNVLLQWSDGEKVFLIGQVIFALHNSEKNDGSSAVIW